MKFKKQILSEEIGLPKSNRKTYTKNKKQKMVVSEQQLQRLISKITNKSQRPRPTALAEQFGEGWTCTPIGCQSVTITSLSQIQQGMFTSLNACVSSGCGTIGTPAQPTGEVGLADDNASLTPANPQTTNTSPVNKRKKCCKCGPNPQYSIGTDETCPKSCPQVKCGTPPTNSVGLTENRTLKTTNPITESDIKDMKKWFNRVNKSGRGYNPSVI